ncbi:hypothetical protein P153DRAFT_322501 [Dothidotthia symphoricarpi CBS 119687]|uniref:GDP/GTP exchange factor Sec2 N-terminal domain-containing protein n=1 Tax=Dothidotthia symphoricarpi CBS 119687 TaxID=1392245 RepID=A0A6A6A623_9PLEO|nr:uncharacterized protein P153DRAFT_322501 [Dothidotthia symphoricarpi CBS 119687]KAF2126524.1 hypothetical protein P153DRAFT_322501 [Dothidotthia symphoricarpi CBS 119687]
MASSIEEESPPPVPPKPTQHVASEAESCPTCGDSVPSDIHDLEDAKRRIMELEAQVQFLKEKATAAVYKYADYEDQIRALKGVSTPMKLPRSYTAPTLELSQPSTDDPRPTTPSSGAQAQSRFSFFTNRRPLTNNAMPLLSSPPPDTDLLNELERERALRTKAEDRARTIDLEIEELSVTLFSQANEMVAEERRARAKLEERIEMLEKKDKDKAGRLERLEKAVARVARVKVILEEPDKTVSNTSDVMSTILAPPIQV